MRGVADDKEQNDRLIQAAVAFCEQHAKTYQAPAAGGGSGGSVARDEWQLVPGQAVNYKFVATGEAADGQRPFRVQIGWLDAFDLGMTLRFPVCPGRVEGLVFRLPSVEEARGKAMAVSTTVDAAAMKKSSFVVTSLQLKTAVVDAAGSGAAGNEATGNSAAGNGGGGNGAAGNGEGSSAAGNGEGMAVAGTDRARDPVPSRILPPIPIVYAHAQLEAIDYVPAQAEALGDCFPLSAAAGFKLTSDQCAHPDVDAVEHVRVTRNAAIDLVAGFAAVGGIEASVFRSEEKLPPSAADAEEVMALWRANYYWEAPEGEENQAACFQFGVAAINKRPAIVLEKTVDKKGYLNPLRVYADTTTDASLRRSSAKPNKPETVPSYFLMPFDEALAALQSGMSYSLVGYDRRASHFFPFVKKELAPTEVNDDQLDVDAMEAEVAEANGEEDAAVGEADGGVQAANGVAAAELTDAEIAA
jgi:hypothetical protein